MVAKYGVLSKQIILKLFIKNCKKILGVKTVTNNLLVFSEYIQRYIRIIKYWLNLYNKTSENCVLQTVLRNQKQKTLSEVQNWSFNVKHLLESSGLAHVWNYPESANMDVFESTLSYDA